MVDAQINLSHLIGIEVGGYRIAKLLGQGGMGAVFAATHKTLPLRTAIKVMLPPAQGEANQLAVQRFLDEARALSEVQHSSLVKLSDSGTLRDGTIYMQMELLNGESMMRRLRPPYARPPFSLRSAIELGRQMAAALQVVHARGIVHRDLKPHNVLVVPDAEAPYGERAKILDFGIAKIQGVAAGSTFEGRLLGTPRYMSPEQCEGSPLIDDRTDVYSLALVLFELMTGELPYEVSDEAPLAWLYAHINQRPRPLRGLLPDALPELESLLSAMLDKMPQQRPDMGEVAARLAAFAASLSVSPSEQPAGTAPIDQTGTLDGGLGGGARPSLLKKQAPSERHDSRRQIIGLVLLVLLGAVMIVPLRRLLDHFNLALLPRWDRGEPLRDVDDAVAMAHAPSGMAFVPGRRFLMGSTPEQIDGDYQECFSFAKDCDRIDLERELSAHLVTVSAFYIDRYEVTNAKFAEWLNLPLLQPHVKDGRKVHSRQGKLILDLHAQHGGIDYSDGKFAARPGWESRPVVQVTWFGARKFCEAFGRTLPSEAQWELAARGLGQRRSTAPSRWPWGDAPPTCEGVVVARDKAGACAHLAPGTAPVGSAPQDVTPLGIHDLGGNVREWVLDRFVAPYPDCQACVDPIQNSDGTGVNEPGFRVVRGGNWVQNPSRGRSASRALFDEEAVAISIGFRCAAAVVR